MACNQSGSYKSKKQMKHFGIFLFWRHFLNEFLFVIKYIRIQPSRGTVEVNQNKLCKVTFISKDKPAFYNLDLICEVSFIKFQHYSNSALTMFCLWKKIKNETEMDQYREEIEQWKYEQTRQFQEFVIEESELENRLVNWIKSDFSKQNRLI